ncbi:MAG: dienelactone hydrolase family protein [Gemmatimonadetes bacterium]|nr:dienelactone hydrolase family protein [Gemmatimonadota bacterium]
MRRDAYRNRLIRLVVNASLVASACGGAASDSDGISARPADLATGGDSLPAALLGMAPPPAGQPVRYFAPDSQTMGYLAVPTDDGSHPAVILIHEWDGLNDRVRQVADALAEEGYVALVADLYRSRTGNNQNENMALVREARGDMTTVIANLDGAQRFLRARDDVTGGIATIGWCFGGGIALSDALGGEEHEGTAIFYGQLLTDPAELARIDHEIYGTFAEMDSGIPPDEVERFVAALREAGVPNDVHVYDAVDHGFWLWVDREPDRGLAPAVDAWRRLQAYLSRTLLVSLWMR